MRSEAAKNEDVTIRGTGGEDAARLIEADAVNGTLFLGGKGEKVRFT